jgi:RpiR family carbohydrate utilization transcriptional regulator
MRTKDLAPSKAGCLIRIKSAMDSFKPSERMIAEFVLKGPERVVQMSISELARDVDVGESTVMRFCRALDYKGYQEFKLRLAQDLVEPVAYIHENISFDDSAGKLAQKIFQTNLQAVQDTMKALDPGMVEVAAKTLTRARRIDIYGAGYSFFTALDAKLKLTRVGLLADAYGDGHLQLMAAASLTARDVAIGISHSGSTKDAVDALSAARKSGAATIAITNFSPSPLTKMADVVLLTASHETPMGGEVLTSRIAQLCVIDVLSVAVAVALGESCLGLIKKTSEAVKKKRY